MDMPTDHIEKEDIEKEDTEGAENPMVKEESGDKDRHSDQLRTQEAEWSIIAGVVDKIAFIINVLMLILSVGFVFPKPISYEDTVHV